jgi:nucleotide-binding universal stress UspA family protein
VSALHCEYIVVPATRGTEPTGARHAFDSRFDPTWDIDRREPLIVLVDGSTAARRAVQVAITLAQESASRLLFVGSLPGEEQDPALDALLLSEALQSRMRHGNIYPPERAQTALQSFFRIGNLQALRDMALRRTMQEVDGQLEQYMREHDLSGWRPEERVLICFDHRQISDTLLRRAARMARGMQEQLFALYIKDDEAEKARATLDTHVKLAESLEAEVKERQTARRQRGQRAYGGAITAAAILALQRRAGGAQIELRLNFAGCGAGATAVATNMPVVHQRDGQGDRGAIEHDGQEAAEQQERDGVPGHDGAHRLRQQRPQQARRGRSLSLPRPLLEQPRDGAASKLLVR